MTRLLVSVRDIREAQAAVCGGADLVDIKEPLKGSLGAASADTWQRIVREFGGTTLLSAAMGELLELDQCRYEALRGLTFAKLGLAGCAVVSKWQLRWQHVLDRLPDGVEAAAVVYADWPHARGPEPMEIIEYAKRLRCSAVLFDTFEKHRGNLLDHLPMQQLAALASAVRTYDMKLVLAGSLTMDIMPQITSLRPDYVAVRGAVCGGDRTTAVNETLVSELAQWLHLRSDQDELEATQKQFESFA